MVLSSNIGIYPMKTSFTVSIIAMAIATISISVIAKTVSASSSSHAPLIVISQQPVQTPANEAKEATQLQSLAKIPASQAQQTAEAAQGNKASSIKLENEDGNLIYAVNIGQNEVAVDAGNGRILYTQNMAAKEEVESASSRLRSSIQVAEAEDGETNDDEK